MKRGRELRGEQVQRAAGGGAGGGGGPVQHQAEVLRQVGQEEEAEEDVGEARPPDQTS